jgi:phytoene synthase
MPDPHAALSRIGQIVRRADPDRFLTALFAPAAQREALFTLYAFNVELSRARDVASSPVVAMIRLQWWREVVDGAVRAHEVAMPLSALLDEGQLDRAELNSVVDAREAEADTIETLDDWRAFLLAGPGGLAMAAARLLGAEASDAVRQAGAAYGLAGVLRSVPALASRGRCLLPEAVLAEHGMSIEGVVAEPANPRLRPALAVLAKQAGPWLAAAHTVRGSAVPACLPAVLARRDLRNPGDSRPRGLGDRLAITKAALLGRV